MNTIDINGFPHHMSVLKGYSSHEQNEIMTIWFMDNFDRISFDDRLIFGNVQYDAVEPYEVLTDFFGGWIPGDIIGDTASELDPEGDEIWVPKIDYSAYWPENDIEPDAYEAFQASIDRINEMMKSAHMLGSDDLQQHFFQILYANVFTTLEAYMVRAFINKVLKNNDNLHQFLSKQREFEFENPKLVDILRGQEYIDELIEAIRKKLKVELIKASWHDLRKVSSRFNCLGIDLKVSEFKLNEVIKKRHDIIHRNGRTPDDSKLIISLEDIMFAINTATVIADTIRADELGFESNHEDVRTTSER